MSQQAPSVFMADLTYDTTVISVEYFPIGIGYVTAYAAKCLPGHFSFQLYKFPDLLLDAIDASPPDILALSFFAWNKNLSLLVARHYKRLRPDGLVVLGGPALAEDADRRREFFRKNIEVDVFILYDGELGFVEMLRRYLQMPVPEDWRQPIGGCVFYDRRRDLLVQGEIIRRVDDIEAVDSPYLTGLMDPFFDNEQLTPIIQSTRGCPFTCSYCCAGNDYNSRVKHFFIQRVIAEIDYIAERRKNSTNKQLAFADSNFCMYAQDELIVERIAQLQAEHGFPSSFSAPLGKNKKERVFRAIKNIKNAIAIISIQSTDPSILSQVRRQKFDKEMHREAVQRFRSLGIPVETEVITGLPGETRETHLQTIRDVIDIGISEIHPFTLMLLEGSELDLPQSHEKYGWDLRYRILPRDFGCYRGEICFEVETVAVGSKSLSFDDYLYLRGFHVILRIVFNNAFYEEYTNYLRQAGADIFEFCMQFYDNIRHDPSWVGKRFRSFIQETRDEIWDSREALEEHFRQEQNYSKLLAGECGENLLGKFKTLTISEHFDLWCDYYHEQVLLHLSDRQGCAELETQLADIHAHILAKAEQAISPENMRGTPVEVDLRHDVPGWVEDRFSLPLANYRSAEPLPYEYVLDEDARRIVAEILRLNSTSSAMWKAISSRYYLPTFFRKGHCIARDQRNSEGAER